MLRLLVLILALASSSAYRSYLRANGRRLPVERGVLVHPHRFRAEYTMGGARKATRRLNMQGRSAMKTTVHSGRRIFNSGIGIPQGLKQMNVWKQSAIVLLYYSLHVVVFPHFEYTLNPLNEFLYNSMGFDIGVGLDDLVGVLVLLLTFGYHKLNGFSLPRLFNVSHKKAPWGKVTLRPAPAFSLVVSIFMLYYLTGRLYPFFTTAMAYLDAYVLPMTEPIRQNLVVVMLHCAWVAPSVGLLKKVDNFFPPQKIDKTKSAAALHDASVDDGVGAAEVEMEAYGDEDKRVEASHGGTNLWGTRSGKSAWWSSTRRANWVWWVVGGYAVTLLFSHAADIANTLFLPERWLGGHERNVVSRMTAYGAEGVGESFSPFAPGLGIGPLADALALGIGSVAPCISAPWWEELFYRGFVYPWLASFLPMLLATPGSALLFAAHHAQGDALLPLSTLGLTWALLYLLSGNLFVVMVVHAMWNSRIFLTSLLALVYR